MHRTIAVPLLAATLWCAGAHHAFATDWVLENSKVRVVFSSHATFGFVPKSVTNLLTGFTFHFGADALWTATLWTPLNVSSQYDLTSGDLGVQVGSTAAQLSTLPNGDKLLVLQWLDVRRIQMGEPRIDVKVTVLLPANDAEAELSAELTFRSLPTPNRALHSLVFPRLAIQAMHSAGQRASERAVWPLKAGSIVDDPIAHLTSTQGRFQPGVLSHQLYGYYDDDSKDAICLHTTDGVGITKAISFYGEANAMHYVLRNYAATPLALGSSYTMPYKHRVCAMNGDWMDMGDHYRAWAQGTRFVTRPMTYNSVSPAIQRASMFDHAAVCQGMNCTPTMPPPFDPNCPTVGWTAADFYLRNWQLPALDVDTIICRGGNWAIPMVNECDLKNPDPGLPWPTYASITQGLRNVDIHLMPYTFPISWDTDDPGYPAVSGYTLRAQDGNPVFVDTPGGALMCTGTSFWRAKFVDVLDDIRTNTGATGLYLDYWSIIPAPICYAADHGHVAGDPSVFLQGQFDEANALRQLGRSQDPEFFLTTEALNEALIPVVEWQFAQLQDAYPIPGPSYVHPCPMYMWIYNRNIDHSYFLGYLASLPKATCVEVIESYTFYEAMNLHWGISPQVGEGGLDVTGGLVGTNPSGQGDFPVLDFIARLGRSLHQLRKFLLDGDMKRLNVVDVETVLPASFLECVTPQHQPAHFSWPIEDQQPLVFASLRHHAPDGTWGISLINWKSESHLITIRVTPADVEQSGSTVRLTPIANDGFPAAGSIIDVTAASNFETTISVPARTLRAFAVTVLP